MPWYPRECAGCGVRLAATTDDPDVKVMCFECDPSDLPVYVDPEREREMREQADPDYFAEHGDDVIPVKLIDLACVVARMRQASAEEGFTVGSVVHERIFTCDLPRLEGYLPEQALREIGDDE